jgi:hypothetical protein
MENETWVQIPMPSLLADGVDTPSDRDPATSAEAGPGVDRPAENDRLAAYARQLWSELARVSQYLRDRVAGGGSGPLLAETTPLLTSNDQWLQWREVYARALSTLAGPAAAKVMGPSKLSCSNRRRYNRAEWRRLSVRAQAHAVPDDVAAR